MKFHEGGWATLLVTGLLVAAAFAIKRHYRHVATQLHRLDTLLVQPLALRPSPSPSSSPAPDPSARTAILLVNGYNGLGLHTALHVPRLFGESFKNFVFISVGSVDAGNFKGADELAHLRTHTAAEAERYAVWARAHGYRAATFTAIGHDVTDEILRLAETARAQFPNSVFFAGQLLFARETRLTRLLHNQTAIALQHRFWIANLPFVILPIRV